MGRKRFVVIALLAVALGTAALALRSFWRTPSYENVHHHYRSVIVGAAHDSSGSPVAGAMVALECSWNNFERNFTTESNGTFRMSYYTTSTVPLDCEVVLRA